MGPVNQWTGLGQGLDGGQCRRGAAEVKKPAEICADGRQIALCQKGLPVLRLCHMAETTTIRLPPKLRARLRQIAKETDRSVHSLILEAVEKHAAYEEQMRKLVKEALAADAEIDRTGEVYRAEDVHAWAERLAQGIASPRPKPWRK